MKSNSGFQNWNQPYLFQELEDILKGFTESQRREIIPLAIGDPDLPTPVGIRDAMVRSLRDNYFGYPSIEGELKLREAISEYYFQRFGVGVAPDEIFVGPGAKTDLFDLCAVFADPGDTVMILDPAYPVYRDAALFRKLDICYLRGTAANGFQPPVPEDMQDADSAALIFLCYPNNPTGVTASEGYIQEMVHYALKTGTMIVHDIAYADFKPGNSAPETSSIFSFAGGDRTGIEVGSFSKPFSMTSDRISWVAIRNPVARKLWRRYRANRDSGVSQHIQAGALAALTDPGVQTQVAENMSVYGERAAALKAGIKAMNLTVSGLENSPYAWFQSPLPDSKKAAGIILKQGKIQVTPGIGFGPAGEGYLRATIFQPIEKIRTALSILAQLDFNQPIE